MKTKEILKKDNYFRLVNAMKYNPDSLDDETLRKIRDIEDMFQDKNILEYQNNMVLILRMFVKEQKTIEQIAEERHISTRHVDRLKHQAIETIASVLDTR